MTAVCLAPRHGNITAYKLGCRCPDASRAGARSQKAHRTRVARGQKFHTDSTGAQRRIRALAAIGWRARDIAERIGTTPQCVSQIGQRPTIYASTARRVAAVYQDLADTPGPSRITQARALKAGWLPPKWWDVDLIDDPSYQPPTQETPHWSDVDPVAVERACAGDRIRLTRAERIEAVRVLRGQDLSLNQIAKRLRIEQRQVTRDLDEQPMDVAS